MTYISGSCKLVKNKPTYGIDAGKHDGIGYSQEIKILNNSFNENKSSGVEDESMTPLFASDASEIQITTTGNNAYSNYFYA